MVAWSCKTLKFCEKFLRFFQQTTPYKNVRNYVPKVFIATRSTLLCSNFVKFDGKLVKSALFSGLKTQNFACLSNRWYCADCTQNLPGPPPINVLCSQLYPNRFTFGGVIAEHVNTVSPPNRPVKWIQYSAGSLVSGWIIFAIHQFVLILLNKMLCYMVCVDNAKASSSSEVHKWKRCNR